MIIPEMWSFIQDDNNYIGKYGKLTTICPVCGNIYTADLKMEMTCKMNPYQEGYRFKENPEIIKMCSCSGEDVPTIRIDNSLIEIIGILRDKAYTIKYDKCCEGHIYQNGTEVIGKTVPVIEIGENLFMSKKFPNPNNTIVELSSSNNGSVIKPFIVQNPTDYTVEQYENMKVRWLKHLKNFVNDLPNANEVRNHCNYKCNKFFCNECGTII